MALSGDLIYIINHVFLPPKLHQQDDDEGRENEALLSGCMKAWDLFQPHIPMEERSNWAACSGMLRRMREMRNSSGTIIPNRVEDMLTSMSQNDILAFHIGAQNAALIIRKMDEQFSFEAFELSPTNKAVMSTKGRLGRFFPGPVIAISQERMADPSFPAALVQMIATLDVQTPPEAFTASSKKQPDEIVVQDTIHPKFVTEMLFGVLRGLGKPLDVHRIEKRTRDDVLFDGTRKPWRRSPFWLLLRVALQTTLAKSGDQDHTLYKSFMIFFMGHVLKRSLEADLSSELLFAMSAKISRRLLKLGTYELPWIKIVHNHIEVVQQELAARWCAIERNQDPSQLQADWDPSKLSFEQDTRLSLQNLGPYLRSIPFREVVHRERLDFAPHCHQRVEQASTQFPSLIVPESEIETNLWLADVELWIEDHLGEWLKTSPCCPNATTLLSELITEYTTLAASSYTGSPVAMSLLVLNAVDLWVALDKCAIYRCPILSQYNPEIPDGIFDRLLLPTRSQMERLVTIEDYLRQRRYLITTSVFHSVSFAAQYYERSPRHQQLRRRIEADAQEQRNRKILELREKKQKYQDLMRNSETRTCEYGTHMDRGQLQTHHSPNCRRCQIKWEANRIEIGVHEWPLPHGEYATKAAVFELDVPAPLADWRHATYLLLVDLLSPPDYQAQRTNDDKTYYMRDYSGLSNYAKSKASRLQLASASTSFLVERYAKVPIYEATEQNICVSNGLSYSLYDSKSRRWTKDLLGNYSIRDFCTFQLPPGPYQQLQSSLSDTIHSPNEALAKQSTCPESINLHEFYAFTSLRCGNKLQWRNIARELVSRILDFSREETHLLILQTIWEVGKSGEGGVYRDSHLDLKEEDFATSLLEVLHEALAAVGGSWQGVVATRTFVALALRVLSLSPYTKVKAQCFRILEQARVASLQWMREVAQVLDQSKDLDDVSYMSIRVLEMALTCHSTFDVERFHAPEIFSSSTSFSIFIECSITIHDHCPAITNNLPQPIKSLLDTFAKRSHTLESFVRHYSLTSQQSLHDIIHRIWSGYRPNGVWCALPAPNERWLGTTTQSEESYSQMTVHYNVLDGSLLVNGLPLTRLPQSYQLHASYGRLFGEKVLTVVPSSMIGMVFETRNQLFGQQIHFAMADSELIIRTRIKDEVYELLPEQFLETDFPKILVQDYVHWLHTTTGSVEWRRLTRMWGSAQSDWLMQAESSKEYRLLSNGKSLIDVRSATLREISRLLSPLEDSMHIHVIYDISTNGINIHLPRFKLDFLLRPNDTVLESKQYRGMVVDKVQCMGTLSGLVNKLVLRSISSESRIVLVPQGKVSFETQGHHVRVMIDTGDAPHVHYHAYTVDDQLGRLVDNGNLQSRLFRIYLHATTSHCLIDQLTGRTGTEEALNSLASAATRSFVKLEHAEIELLELIAGLTPSRQFYPEDSRESQQIDWLEGPPSSQHGKFRALVRSIFDQARLYQIFQETDTQIPDLESRGTQYLLDRAAIRDSSFQVHGFGAESHSTEYDVLYVSRDQAIGSYRELHACNTARLVDNWSQNLEAHSHLLLEIESWGEPIQASPAVDQFTFGFDIRWLEAAKKFLPTTFFALQRQLSQASRDQDKYKKLAGVVESFFRPFDDCPESKLLKMPGETRRMVERRREDEYHLAKAQHVQEFVEKLMSTSCLRDFSKILVSSHSSHIMVDEAVLALQPWFESWERNARFQQHIEKIQAVLNRLQPLRDTSELFTFSPPSSKYNPKRTHIRFFDLVAKPVPDYVLVGEDDFRSWVTHTKHKAADRRPLKDLLGRVTSRSLSKHDQRYAADLLRSYEALSGDVSAQLTVPESHLPLLQKHLEQARRQEHDSYESIRSHLESGQSHASRQSHMLPRLSRLSILAQLARDKFKNLPLGWRKVIVQYGMSIAVLQRADRLLKAAQNPANAAELLGELNNPGHQNWNPIDHPDWLLVEVENNILLRQEQSQIAQEMVSPSSGSNSVLQLSMGLGKSSVIVPISAAKLADQTKAVRVIVLKPLIMQMFNILRQKLGGLLNRRVIYMPITRSLKLDGSRVIQIQSLLEEAMHTGAIVVMQPEHILSFELMGFEKLLSDDLDLGRSLIQTQMWLDTNSRDVIDESDEILSVKYELIYTLGMQQATEFSPDRWTIVQGVLDVLGRCAHQVLPLFPDGLELITTQAGAFPRVRIIRKEASDALLKAVAQQVCENGIPGVPLWRLPRGTRMALFQYLVDTSWTSAATEPSHDFASGSQSVKKALLLLRGLIGRGVLKFCLEQKRWRVHYGLDLSRTKLAVPYYAKDTPSPRTEFSHPDATIVLTCLSYYYGGLSIEQMLASFEALLQSDHAAEEYAHWVQDTPQLPAAFRQLTGINLGNLQQFRNDIYPSLRFTRRIVNFYLSNIVFPAEMKDFPEKLSSSGWDIARQKRYSTTGFSGTNDSRYYLPLSISQCDLPQQLSTNAAVLSRLLRPENIVSDMSQASPTGTLSASALIKRASELDPPARVILDVGAQVLDLQNEEMAKKWLSSISESEAQAVIFFDSGNEMCVLSRDGSLERLEISVYSKQMESCLVYLDQAHTIGVDLKMPVNYRALVTLGPNLTKDRLMQACMRMRKLGEGQSVALCCSAEIQSKILANFGNPNSHEIEVSDVLEWCIYNTCADYRKSIPLWATQGFRYQRRHVICSQPLINSNGGVAEELVKELHEKEAQSLQERYGNDVSELEEQFSPGSTNMDTFRGREQQVAEIRARCEELELSAFGMANLYEEQERELSPENEREKQVERPLAAIPFKHVMHPDVQFLVTHGVLKRSSDAFRPAFDTLRDTTAKTHYEKSWPKDLLVTTDFSQTVHGVSKQFLNAYLRPVNWVISCKEGSGINLVVVSPFEAQELMPLIRKHKRIALHVYAPRLNMSTRKLDDLSFCAIPLMPKSWQAPSVRNLNIFAGQLYVKDFEEYVALCCFLGLSYKAPEGNMQVAADGFVSPSSRALSSAVMLRMSPFTKSPVEFLRKILAMRRKEHSIAMSHLGMILNGELISEESFQGADNGRLG
ncbi:hypothetical protein BKA64DRAFT_574675 [Cadophora sp. MPI-SDFR-AT-0126]|nr:hypothetical protein BKA64DRAFT_574675 [Leotiomycetes sp. MPI-SDFR-AT-0126]